MLNTYQLYLKEINDIPPLSKDTEQKYFMAWKNYGMESARKKIYRSNLRFVVKTAHNYKNQGVDILDLISEGNMALDTAMERFDYTTGNKFISYAVWYIRQAMLELLARQSRFVSITGAEAVFKANFNKAVCKLMQKLNRMPTEEEIAKETKFTLEKIKHMNRMLSNSTGISIDEPIYVNSNKKNTLRDVIADDRFDLPDVSDNLTEIILKKFDEAGLKNKEIDILCSLFGINRPKRNLEEISFDYGQTRERMRQIKEKALKTLKAFDRTNTALGNVNTLRSLL